MNATMIDAAGFARIIAEKQLGFATIDELCDIADESDVWTDDLVDRGMRALKKSLIRRLMRKKVKGDDGKTIEWVNIVQVTRKGNAAPAYKQLSFLDIGEFVQLIRDRKGRVAHYEKEYARFCKLAVSKFGREIQDRFDFDIPIDG